MEAESHRAKGGEGISGIRSEESPVLSLCGTMECAGRVGAQGGSRFPPPTETMVCR